MKNLKEFINESLVNESQYNGKCIWTVANRAENGEFHVCSFNATDLYDVLTQIAKHIIGLEMSDWGSDLLNDNGKYYADVNTPQDERDKIAKEALDDLIDILDEGGEDWEILLIQYDKKDLYNPMNIKNDKKVYREWCEQDEDFPISYEVDTWK